MNDKVPIGGPSKGYASFKPIIGQSGYTNVRHPSGYPGLTDVLGTIDPQGKHRNLYEKHRATQLSTFYQDFKLTGRQKERLDKIDTNYTPVGNGQIGNINIGGAFTPIEGTLTWHMTGRYVWDRNFEGGGLSHEQINEMLILEHDILTKRYPTKHYYEGMVQVQGQIVMQRVRFRDFDTFKGIYEFYMLNMWKTRKSAEEVAELSEYTVVQIRGMDNFIQGLPEHETMLWSCVCPNLIRRRFMFSGVCFKNVHVKKEFGTPTHSLLVQYQGRALVFPKSPNEKKNSTFCEFWYQRKPEGYPNHDPNKAHCKPIQLYIGDESHSIVYRQDQLNNYWINNNKKLQFYNLVRGRCLAKLVDSSLINSKTEEWYFKLQSILKKYRENETIAQKFAMLKDQRRREVIVNRY